MMLIPARTLPVFILALLLLTFGSCDKADEYTEFDMTYTEEVTIPASSGISLPIDILAPETKTNAESKFEVNDTRKDLVEEIRLQSLELTVKSPADEDFSFLESVEVFLSAEGEEELRVAWRENVPDNASSELDLRVNESDLQRYLKKQTIQLRVEAVTDEALGEDHTIEAKSVFQVNAEVLGQ